MANLSEPGADRALDEGSELHGEPHGEPHGELHEPYCGPDARRIELRHLHALNRWVEHHILPGSFLQAVIQNNLKEAVARGDERSVVNLPHIVAYLYNNAPAGCWGTPERVASWTQSG